MGPLLTFLAKQTGLQTLNMEKNNLSDAHKDQIRQVVPQAEFLVVVRAMGELRRKSR